MLDQRRRHHYVPIWYQKRFIEPSSCEKTLYLRDLQPPEYVDSKGVHHRPPAVYPRSPKNAFCKEDLYKAEEGPLREIDIEGELFGAIDIKGAASVEALERFTHPWNGTQFLAGLLRYMSAQKLRTTKGLAWLEQNWRQGNAESALERMVEFREVFFSVWAEAVWQIADASQSETKFIISDHPVTVYNRRCGPRSEFCRGVNDPNILMNGTHTLFPLSRDRLLILTNLSWVRNPYQSEVAHRPNPRYYHMAVSGYDDIQISRTLTEQEVREINFIIKSRALRYVAAGKREWLYPEHSVSKADWHRFGQGYLLMPDPRSVLYGGLTYVGHMNGTASAFDEYGRRPAQPGFRGHGAPFDEDWRTFHRFQGEFARLFGPVRRGRANIFGKLDRERDSAERHQEFLEQEKQYR